MAASLSEIYPKRKLELEDITNRHKKAKQGKEYFHHPVQERLPSPLSPTALSLPPQKHHRQKSVSFELSRNEHYENLPLLTPKEDDYVSDSEQHHHDESSTESKPQHLDSNPDYVALGATADMLAVTKSKIEDDLAELSELRKAAKYESKLALVDFYVRLICNDSTPNTSSSSSSTRQAGPEPAQAQEAQEGKLNSKASSASLPQQHRIVSAPTVNWGKYHKGLQNASLSHDCTNDYEKVFKGLKMFPN